MPCPSSQSPPLPASRSVWWATVVARTEQGGHLVVTVAHDRFLERYQVGLQLAEALDEHAPSSVPLPSSSPQVERRDADPARTGFLLHSEPPSRLLPRIHLAEA